MKPKINHESCLKFVNLSKILVEAQGSGCTNTLGLVGLIAVIGPDGVWIHLVSFNLDEW